MTKRPGLPKRVYEKHGRYWFVDATGKWNALTRVSEGLPAMFRALATLTDRELRNDTMPAVAARWVEFKLPHWAPGTAEDMKRSADLVARRFAEFRPSEVTTPVCWEFLSAYRGTPRAHNRHRTVLKGILAFAAREGLREGFSPLDNIPQMRMEPRRRIVTDAEVKALKTALMQQARGGATHCLMVDLCMLTGQRIGAVLKMRWQDVTDDGLLVDQGKTDARLTIEWTPELRQVIDACAAGRDRIGYLLVQSTGKPYRYAGVRSAWVRALARAGIEDLHIHDLRGRAGADVTDERGIEEAQRLLGHESVRMTEHYVRGKTRRRARPAGAK